MRGIAQAARLMAACVAAILGTALAPSLAIAARAPVVTNDGALWLPTDGGVRRLAADGASTTFPVPVAPTGSALSGLISTDGGNGVWLTTGGELAHVSVEGAVTIHPVTGVVGTIYDLHADADGSVALLESWNQYECGSGRIARWRAGSGTSWSPHLRVPGPASMSQFAGRSLPLMPDSAVLPDRFGATWFDAKVLLVTTNTPWVNCSPAVPDQLTGSPIFNPSVARLGADGQLGVLPNLFANDVARANDGTVWTRQRVRNDSPGSGGDLVRHDQPGFGGTTYVLPDHWAVRNFAVPGPNGSLWMRIANDKVGSVSAGGEFREYAIDAAVLADTPGPQPWDEPRPVDLRVGPDGGLWILRPGGNTVPISPTPGVVVAAGTRRPTASGETPKATDAVAPKLKVTKRLSGKMIGRRRSLAVQASGLPAGVPVRLSLDVADATARSGGWRTRKTKARGRLTLASTTLPANANGDASVTLRLSKPHRERLARAARRRAFALRVVARGAGGKLLATAQVKVTRRPAAKRG